MPFILALKGRAFWHRVVKKSLESDYPRPEAGALRPIHGFATAISRAFFRQSQMNVTQPRGRGLLRRKKLIFVPWYVGQIMLRVNNIEVVYNKVIQVIAGLSLEVPDKSIVALLGRNGAGKSTTMKALSGLLKAENGEVTEGSIEYKGKDITKYPPDLIVRNGIFLVMEGRRIFSDLTVEENLRAGAFIHSGKSSLKEGLETVYKHFSILKIRKNLLGGYLSGGEQQMLAIGRALMAKPQLLLSDEPSLGLAPLLVKELFSIIRNINLDYGTSILLVEQNAPGALSIANYGYILENGRIVMNGDRHTLLNNVDIKEFYLGLGEGKKKRSFKNLKHYKRRKRWIA
jgi:branched-chain amino acid transport system ATP-binding protein